MGYEIAWLAGYEGRIIHERLTGEITAEDVRALVADVNQMMDAQSQRVHLLIDTIGITQHVSSLTALRNTSPGPNHPNLGWVAMVGPSMLMSTLVKIVAQLVKFEFRAFPTLDEALAFLRERDATLNQR